MRILGWLAMALAVVGVVAGLALATGVWAIRTGIEDRAVELIVSADQGLERATELSAKVGSKLTDVSGQVADLSVRADELAAAPLVDPATRDQLATTISTFVEGPYADLQERYATLRERVLAIDAALSMLDQAIPAIELPGTIMERLTAIDERIMNIDTLITDVSGMATDRLSGPSVSAQLATQLDRAEELLATASGALAEVDARLAATDDRLTGADERIANLLTGVAVGATLFGLYLAGLNVLLFRQGRRWAAPPATPSAPMSPGA